MSTKGFDGEVCIGVPIGYPPTAVVSATSLDLPHNSLDSIDSSPERSNCRRFLHKHIWCFVFLVFVCLFALVIFGLPVLTDTRFKIESISVDLDKSDLSYNQSQAIRATWDVGFSITNSGRQTSVSVRCLSSNWSSSVVQDSDNMTSVHTVVTTSLPREFVLSDHNNDQLKMGGLTLQFDVLIQTSMSRSSLMYEGMCKNMSIVIPPNQTQGFLVGGPRKCH